MNAVAERRPPLLSVHGLRRHFPLRGGLFNREVATVRAVDGVSFELHRGETLGVVGESGCGKSTTARLLMGLLDADAGSVEFDGRPVGGPGGLDRKQLLSRVQMVFQDSHATLNPRLTVEETIAFGPQVHGLDRQAARERARTLLDRVGLAPDRYLRRYPHELSGGQRQRVNIARALAFEPTLVLFDEAVSALDKSIEAQVLNLLVELKAELDLTYLFISHDLNVVRWISDRVLVMYLGEVVELAPTEAIYERPAHPYTRALIASMPSMDPTRRSATVALTGDPPNPIDPPSGCRFHTRCSLAIPVCAERTPALLVTEDVDADPQAHRVACHLCPAPGRPPVAAGTASA